MKDRKMAIEIIPGKLAMMGKNSRQTFFCPTSFCHISSLVFLLVVLLLSLICNLHLSCNKYDEKETLSSTNTDTAVAHLTPTPVQVSSAFRGTLIQRITTTGLAVAVRTVTIRPKISGSIARLPVIEGQRVKKGDLLLQLDDKELKVALEEAHAGYMQATIEYGKIIGERKHSTSRLEEKESQFLNVSEAERKLRELDTLDAQGKVSESQLLWAQAELEAAKMFSSNEKKNLIAFQSGLTQSNLRLRRAQLDLDNARIAADFDGVVGDIQVNRGDWVSSGQECLKLFDLSQVIINTGVIETEVNAIATGREARVTFPAVPEKNFAGKIVSISPVVDEKSRTVKVRISVPNSQNLIKAGMFASAKIDARIYPNLFLIPKSAILERDKRKLVFIVRDNLAKWCYVETGLENEDYIEIISSKFDLKVGEPVITSGHYTLVHDAPVIVKED